MSLVGVDSEGEFAALLKVPAAVLTIDDVGCRLIDFGFRTAGRGAVARFVMPATLRLGEGEIMSIVGLNIECIGEYTAAGSGLGHGRGIGFVPAAAEIVEEVEFSSFVAAGLIATLQLAEEANIARGSVDAAILDVVAGDIVGLRTVIVIVEDDAVVSLFLYCYLVIGFAVSAGNGLRKLLAGPFSACFRIVGIKSYGRPVVVVTEIEGIDILYRRAGLGDGKLLGIETEGECIFAGTEVEFGILMVAVLHLEWSIERNLDRTAVRRSIPGAVDFNTELAVGFHFFSKDVGAVGFRQLHTFPALITENVGMDFHFSRLPRGESEEHCQK